MLELARGAMEELRAVVFELRPGSLEAEGLATVLRKHVEVLRRVSGQRIELLRLRRPAARARPGDPGAADRPGGARQRAPPRRRRRGSRCGCTGGDGTLVLTVTDDGCGFDPDGPEVRGQRLGLTSMEERATELGGTLSVNSTLGEGTTVRLEVPA